MSQGNNSHKQIYANEIPSNKLNKDSNQSIEMQCEQCSTMSEGEKCFECKILKQFLSLKTAKL